MRCGHPACRCEIGDEPSPPVEREDRTFCSAACARHDRSASAAEGRCACAHPECIEGLQTEAPGNL